MRVAVRPFGAGGPRYLPGMGGARVIAEVAGERRAAVRDLSAERAAAFRVLDAVAIVGDPGGAFEWQLDDPEECLTLVEALQAMGDDVLVEWPEGARLQVTRAYRVEDLRVSVEGGRDWFGVSGNLTLDDGTVLEMRRLIESARAGRGRFISLGEAGFVALTEDLRQKLDELARSGDTTQTGVRVSPIALGALSETLEGVQLTTDHEWQARLQRLLELEALSVEPSSTLQAELRPYQVDGFRWLARLAHWGAGACLADDMGLGKTVQALASDAAARTERRGAGGCAHVGVRELGSRNAAFCADAARTRIPRRRSRRDPARRRVVRRGGLFVRAVAAGRQGVHQAHVAHAGAGRSPGSEELRDKTCTSGARARSGVSSRDDRHSGGEPFGRAVDVVPVS